MAQYFFGREKELDLLEQKFFVTKPGAGYCAAITGPNDIGKTMLVREAAKRFEQKDHPNVYYFPTQIVAASSYWHFWISLIRSFALRIPERKLREAPKADEYPEFVEIITAAYDFFKNADNVDRIGTDSFHSEATEHLNFIFLAYTTLGIHILITIDEFDVARKAFPYDGGDGSFFQRLYMISPKSSNEYSLSILLMSRRRASTIAHHMADGSDFEAAFPPAIILRGFQEREMDAYFASYRELPCGELTEEQKQQVYYFCGRHPGLLMKLRELYELHYEGQPVLPAQLYLDYGQAMTTTYERITKLLRDEYVDRTNNRRCIGVFSQLFIGPAYDPNLTNYLEHLHKFGLISKRNTASKNIFQLAGLPYEDENERRFDFEPICPYYIEFFRCRILPGDVDGLSQLMNTAEQKVREGILKVLKDTLPDTWEEVLNGFTSGSKQAYRAKLDLIAFQNDAGPRNITYTNLDVLAFTDYSRIICSYWEQMRPYFRSFPTKEALRSAFEFLRDGRNCFAHNNATILDDQHCARLRELCTALVQDYELGEAGVPVEEAAAPTVSAAVITMPTLQQIQELLSGDRRVIFCYQEKKKPKKNLRGYIKGYGYPAGISKAMLSGFGEGFAPEIGTEFEAVIDRWDANAGLFNLVAPANEPTPV